VDPQQFAHAPISAVAAGDYHSAAVKAGSVLHLAKAQVISVGVRRPAHGDLCRWRILVSGPQRRAIQAGADAASGRVAYGGY